MRVLIVDDDMRSAFAIRRAVHEKGMDTDIAVSGEDALLMAGVRRYAWAIIGPSLPGLDGFETRGRLCKLGIEMPVLILAPSDDVVEPCWPDDLLIRLRALAHRRLRRRELVGRWASCTRRFDTVVAPFRQRPRDSER